MGISNLHNYIRHAIIPHMQVALSCGKTRFKDSGNDRLCVGVDVNAWIHRALHGYAASQMKVDQMTNHGACMAKKLNGNDPNDDKNMEGAFVEECVANVMKRLIALRDESGVWVLAVLDGASPPVKAREAEKRKAQRKKDAFTACDNARSVSDRVLAQRRVGCNNTSVMSRIVDKIISQIKKQSDMGVMVAPYEADAQLAYLSKRNIVDLVITEDSDLVVFGAHNIMFKFNHEEQQGQLLRRNALASCCSSFEKSFDVSQFSDAMFTVLCVAAGCDYCEKLKNIGLVTAREIVFNSFSNVSLRDRSSTSSPLDRVFKQLFRQTSASLSDQEKNQYIESFLHALLMFRHPVVYDPILRRSVFSMDPDYEVDLELKSFQKYADLCSNKSLLEKVVGTCHKSSFRAMNIADCWLLPWPPFSMRYSPKDTPDNVRSFLMKSNVKSIKCLTVDKGTDQLQTQIEHTKNFQGNGAPVLVRKRRNGDVEASTHLSKSKGFISAECFENETTGLLREEKSIGEANRNKRNRKDFANNDSSPLTIRPSQILTQPSYALSGKECCSSNISSGNLKLVLEEEREAKHCFSRSLTSDVSTTSKPIRQVNFHQTHSQISSLTLTPDDSHLTPLNSFQNCDYESRTSFSQRIKSTNRIKKGLYSDENSLSPRLDHSKFCKNLYPENNYETQMF